MSGKSRLDEISIRSLGVIENSSLEFGPGFNVLTGETGAGKTMILTAIGLVLGGKSDTSLVRHGADRAVVSSTFSCLKNETNADYLDGSTLLLTRSINADGKSKASAGGVTVAASVLSEVTDGLIEIHGQSANQSLSKSGKQRELLDLFAGDSVLKIFSDYQNSFSKFQELKSHIASMKKNASEREEKVAELEDFLAAGNRIKPKLGELEEIEGELSRLSSIEDLMSASTTALQLLDGDEVGAYATLSSTKRSLDSIVGKDPKLDKISALVNDSVYSLQEALGDLRSYVESLEADPARLEYLQNRRSELAIFLRKYGSGIISDEGIASVITELKGARQVMNDLAGGDDRIAELEGELNKVKKELLNFADKLSSARKAAAARLSSEVSAEIHALAMPHTTLAVRVDHPDYSGALKESDFTLFGCDEISMEIQGHQGGPFLPITKSASGGELSRIMLALEVVIAKVHPVGTYIFDEVDAGVGGAAAIEVGRRLSQLAKNSQVIVITHLPQVAAWATTHFTVKKESDGSVVSSGVRHIDGEDRVEEIARMLAGLGESTSAREHAAELLALRSSE